jgi:hypothetical protein
MINSRPNNKNYHQGNYIPVNKDKLLKLNNEGGVYFRSSLEKKIMVWLDNSKNIRLWSAEHLAIPYQLTHNVNGVPILKTHTYYPDFYYELVKEDESVKKVVVEVKPQSEYSDAILFTEGKFTIPENASLKKLRNVEYRFKMAQKNAEKWKTMIKWCNKKGFEFIIITEETFKKVNL